MVPFGPGKDWLRVKVFSRKSSDVISCVLLPGFGEAGSSPEKLYQKKITKGKKSEIFEVTALLKQSLGREKTGIYKVYMLEIYILITRLIIVFL